MDTEQVNESTNPSGLTSSSPPRVQRTLLPMNSQCFFSVAMGLSVLSWGVIGFTQALQRDELAPGRFVITGLNLAVACLFLFRRQAVRNAAAATIALCIPGIVVAGWALRVSTPLHNWPLVANIVFGIGGGCTVLSFLFLGRNFAILPAVRQIVSNGPYQLIRHPAYLCELVMVFACYLASPAWTTLAPFAAALPLVAMRILAEESVLKRSPSYCDYAQSVRWRLVPLLW